MVELSVLGIAPHNDTGHALLLLHPRNSDRLLPVKIDSAGASVISDLLRAPSSAPAECRAASACERNSLLCRPQGQDFVLNLVEALDAKMVAVDIPRCDGEADIADQDAFLAEAVLSRAGGLCRAQCRLAEGVALALRCGVPIRASGAVLARTRGMHEVLSGLPDHARAVFEAKIRLSGGNPPIGRPPQNLEKTLERTLEKALEERAKKSDDENGRAILSVARKMMDDEKEEARQKTAQDFAAGRPAAGRPVVAPQIRVSLIRQKKGGEAEILNEYHIPASGLPREVIASLGLSGNQAAAANAATDEERWAILLRMLSPETKVLM